MKNSPHEKIIINNVSKETKSVLLMDEVTITVHKGEIFALIGAEGSGKTLLSKIILKLAKKTGGKTKVAGTFGAVVPQQNFYPNQTGLETMQYYASVNIKIISRKRMVNALNLVGLKGIMHHAIGTYNQSQTARLKIAIALVARPEILILDEPLRGLTKEQSREIRFILKTLADKENLAVFITANDMSQIEEICDTVAIIDDGMILSIRSYNDMIADDAPYTKISVTTPTPNYAAQIIEQNLNLEAYLCGPAVIVNTPPANAQKVADELLSNGIKILRIRRVNRPLQEQYYEIMRYLRGHP